MNNAGRQHARVITLSLIDCCGILAAVNASAAAMFTLFCPRRDTIMSIYDGKWVAFLSLPLNFLGVDEPKGPAVNGRVFKLL